MFHVKHHPVAFCRSIAAADPLSLDIGGLAHIVVQ